MVCNNIFGCINPPEWKKYNEEEHNHDMDHNGMTMPPGTTNTRRRRRPRCCGGYTCSSILISLGSDIDIVADCIYYIQTMSQEQVALSSSLRITFSVMLVIAILVWLLQIVEARVGCRQCCGGGVRLLSNHQILWAGILLEDVPQIVLTIMIDLFVQEDGNGGALSIWGVVNMATSVHNGLTKLRALVDDDVEEDYKIPKEPLLNMEEKKEGLTAEHLARLSAEI